MRVFLYPNTPDNLSMVKLLVEQGAEVFVAREQIVIISHNTYCASDRNHEAKKLPKEPPVKMTLDTTPKKSWWQKAKDWDKGN